MTNKDIHELEKQFLSELKPTYTKSKEDVWATLKNVAHKTQPKKEIKIRRLVWPKYAAVASVIIILGLGLFARYYTANITTPIGKTSQHTLPDGSIVYLNAESSIDYHPYWWRFDREISLDGEAFFEVQKGKRFQVRSSRGSVEVLGTSFNVFSREGEFTVYCKTGKVRVRDKHDHQVILIPGQVANEVDGFLSSEKNVDAEEILSWRLNKFIYNTTPISKVMEDFERHYNIKIRLSLPDRRELNYTGLFSRDISAEEALKIVCYSFEMEVEKTEENTYLVKQ